MELHAQVLESDFGGGTLPAMQGYSFICIDFINIIELTLSQLSKISKIRNSYLQSSLNPQKRLTRFNHKLITGRVSSEPGQFNLNIQTKTEQLIVYANIYCMHEAV